MKALSLALVASLVLPLTALAQKSASDQSIGELESVATFQGPMPTGVTVSRQGRIFVNFPRWGDDVPFTVAEIVKGKALPHPSEQVNDWPGRGMPNPNAYQEAPANQNHFVSVQSVVVDPADRLWILDSGAPLLKTVVPGGPKLVCVDLSTNKVIHTILLPPEVAGPNSYMNDVRFDLQTGESGRRIRRR